MESLINHLEPLSQKLLPALQRHFMSSSGGVGGIVYGVNQRVILLDITIVGLTEAIILAAVGSLVGIIVGELFKLLKKLCQKLYNKHVTKKNTP